MALKRIPIKERSSSAATGSSMGDNGFILVNLASGTITGEFDAIKVLGTANATLTLITPLQTLTSKVIIAGDTIPGPFSSVDVASGEVLAYYAPQIKDDSA